MAPNPPAPVANVIRPAVDELGEFTANKRVLLLSAISIVIFIPGAFVAPGLLRLIGLFTNLFFISDGQVHCCRRRTTNSASW